ncbi:hypothetical protein Q3V37_28755 [Micromonospora profundi]|uniref:Uncharacterized protein n=1 Tax=Micromonospora profundi TaxID=1420889 RepID=A0AAJ6HR77_9ACTN|nr:hypothetical protein [Micromonospora profundi]WLS45306.1 hypothetical protein Q3V37_28755 [Micromonospora profundi]
MTACRTGRLAGVPAAGPSRAHSIDVVRQVPRLADCFTELRAPGAF